MDKGEQPIGPIIKKLIKLYRMRSGMLEHDVMEALSKILGKSIVAETDSVSYHEGTLLLKLKSAVLRSELSYSKDQLIQHLNEALGEDLVKEIRLS